MPASQITPTPFRLPVLLLSTVLAVLFAAPAPAQTPCNPTPSSISSDFNGTPIAAGNYILFSSVLHVDGLHATDTMNINITNQTITFNAPGGPYTLNVPDATVTFCP